MSEYYKAWRAANMDHIREYDKEYHNTHKDRINKNRRAWKAANSDKVAATRKKHHERNKDKMNAKTKAYKIANPDKVKAWNAKRRAAKLQRTVAWADDQAIKDIYKDCEEINLAFKAAGCTETFVVDHVVPLVGKLVSGLHVEYNLDIITTAENLSKNNKFIPH